MDKKIDMFIVNRNTVTTNRCKKINERDTIKTSQQCADKTQQLTVMRVEEQCKDNVARQPCFFSIAKMKM